MSRSQFLADANLNSFDSSSSFTQITQGDESRATADANSSPVIRSNPIILAGSDPSYIQAEQENKVSLCVTRNKKKFFFLGSLPIIGLLAVILYFVIRNNQDKPNNNNQHCSVPLYNFAPGLCQPLSEDSISYIIEKGNYLDDFGLYGDNCCPHNPTSECCNEPYYNMKYFSAVGTSVPGAQTGLVYNIYGIVANNTDMARNLLKGCLNDGVFNQLAFSNSCADAHDPNFPTNAVYCAADYRQCAKQDISIFAYSPGPAKTPSSAADSTIYLPSSLWKQAKQITDKSEEKENAKPLSPIKPFKN